VKNDVCGAGCAFGSTKEIIRSPVLRSVFDSALRPETQCRRKVAQTRGELRVEDQRRDQDESVTLRKMVRDEASVTNKGIYVGSAHNFLMR
jgi:hypothetical protein